MLYVFIGHVVLLVLAATNFTVLNVVLPSKHFTCNYYAFAWKTGFGFEYVSDYSLPQILAYLGAYGLGLIVYGFAVTRRWFYLGGLGLTLCALGMVSFLIELSHWVISHHVSFIVSFPVLMLVLWVIWLSMFYRLKKEEALPIQGASR